MDTKRRNTERMQRRKQEFMAGFFAGLAVIGGMALILFVVFWLG